MYKIYPISGLRLNFNFEVLVNHSDGNLVKFVNRECLTEISDKSNPLCKFVSIRDAEEALKTFKVESFAIIPEYSKKNVEVFFLRIALSILRCAQVDYYNEQTSELWSLSVYRHFEYMEYADVKIGISPFTKEEFDIHTPCIYCECSDTLDYKRYPPFIESDMVIVHDIQSRINNISSLLRHQISKNIQSGLNLFYYTLPQNNLELSIVFLSSTLESLLTDDKENSIRKKISVRAACLVAPNKNNSREISFFANWIYLFYKFRCDIVHNARPIIVQEATELILCNKALSIVKYCIPIILTNMIEYKIRSISDLEAYMSNITKLHNLNTSFDFITEELSFGIDD